LKSVGLGSKVAFVNAYLTPVPCERQWRLFSKMLCPNTIGNSYMNSSGLGALVSILKAVRSTGAELFICSLSEQVKMIFHLTKMDRVF